MPEDDEAAHIAKHPKIMGFHGFPSSSHCEARLFAIYYIKSISEFSLIGRFDGMVSWLDRLWSDEEQPAYDASNDWPNSPGLSNMHQECFPYNNQHSNIYVGEPSQLEDCYSTLPELFDLNEEYIPHESQHWNTCDKHPLPPPPAPTNVTLLLPPLANTLLHLRPPTTVTTSDLPPAPTTVTTTTHQHHQCLPPPLSPPQPTTPTTGRKDGRRRPTTCVREPDP